MKILIIGGTGTVGSETVRALLTAGQPVRVLTRSAARRSALPAGVEVAVGDLQSPFTLAPALKGVDRVFLITPLSQNEALEGISAVEAARAAGVRHLVYLSVHRADEAPEIPHFRSKVEIEKAIRDSGIPFTILMPNNFFQNDLWFRQALVDGGVYPQPIGSVGINRVDIRDIADAAVAALTRPGHEGQRYPLVGIESLTGPAIADVWSRHIDRLVRYGGDDLDAWASQASGMLPSWMVHDLRIMYEHFQRHGLLATQEDFREQAKVLGHEPRAFEAFARETADSWMAGARR